MIYALQRMPPLQPVKWLVALLSCLQLRSLQNPNPSFCQRLESLLLIANKTNRATFGFGSSGSLLNLVVFSLVKDFVHLRVLLKSKTKTVFLFMKFAPQWLIVKKSLAFSFPSTFSTIQSKKYVLDAVVAVEYEKRRQC